MPDYRLVNAFVGFLSLYALAIYWRTGKHIELRPSAFALFALILWYVALYTNSIVYDIDNAIVSALARPVFCYIEAASVSAFLVEAFFDDVVIFLKIRGLLRDDTRPTD